jgi:uncharacterized protein YjiS (DUF1127 family)
MQKLRAGNLHDAGPALASGTAALPAAQSKRLNARGKNVQKWLFSLIISCLSYAFFAVLRRNIIAFQAAKHPYFAAKRNHRCNAGFTRKSPVMFANLVRLIREWKRYNQSLNELSRLGDRELADIGISRSDIQRVAWNASHQR